MNICECPQCGAAAAPSDQRCSFCKAEFFITSLAYLGSLDSSSVGKYLKHYKEIIQADPSNPEGLLGLGLCYLQMGSYSNAQQCFAKVMESKPELPQPYYYSALARIAGRRLKTLGMNEVRSIEHHLHLASQLVGDMPQIALLQAMIARDYYETNGMKIKGPPAKELLEGLTGRPISKQELEHIKVAVKVAKEEQFYQSLQVI